MVITKTIPQAPPQRDSTVRLPSKFVLTDKGLNYCAQNRIPIRDFTTHEGRRTSGFFWESIKAPLVQKLVVNQFVEAIDIQRTECLTKRAEIIDLTKLLVYGVIYKKFKPTLDQIILESDIIQNMIKSRTQKNIGSRLQFNPVVVQKFIQENDRTIKTLKTSLTFDPYDKIDADDDLSASEKENKKWIIQKFISLIDDNIWFLFHFINKTDGKIEIINRMSDVLNSFLRKTKIADFTAFMLLEVIQYAENNHYERLASAKRAQTQGKDIAELLQTREFREMLSAEALKKGEFVNINYKFEGDALSLTNRLRLQITIVNKGVIPEHIRRKLQASVQDDGKGVSLNSFFRKFEKEKLAAGLHYLAYLQRACVQEHIKFDSRIVSDHHRDQTFIILVIHL